MAEQGCRAQGWALVIGAVPSSTCLPARYVWTLDLGADGAEQHRSAGPQGKVRRRRHILELTRRESRSADWETKHRATNGRHDAV